jgi:hypothetical protein
MIVSFLKWKRALHALGIAGLTLFVLGVLPAHCATGTVIRIQKGGIGAIAAAPQGDPNAVNVSNIEFDPAFDDNDGESTPGNNSHAFVNRTIAHGPGAPAKASSNGKAKSNPQLQFSMDGLNLFNQRFANGGNQFTVEPPDQALCAGNGYVLESVNDVLRVYDANGTAVVGVTDLNTFYGYPAAINRSNLHFGPSITDPVCLFDAQTQRWFHVVLTLDRVGTSSNLNGNNHFDIAVSNTASPLGSWTIYSVPAQNNGSQGTPDHGCAGGFCLGDYPHIGADANGIYITSNEFALFAPGFYGSQVYAISKQGLTTGATSIPVVLFNTGDYLLDGTPGFTVWPAQSPGVGSYRTDNGGTELLLSSQAVFNDSGVDSRLRIWSITNTGSLNSDSPSISLESHFIATIPYAVPSDSTQKAGDYPQGQLLGAPEGIIGRNDSRMQQVPYANGKLWGALDTGLLVSGRVEAGLAYFVINPSSGKLFNQGYVALENNSLTRPAVVVNESGRGVIGFTVVGDDYYPSAGAGDIHIAAAGLGPQDGFTEYGGRARWGDYGAAALDGNNVWIANEYIGQTCTVAAYLVSPRCGNTRAPLGNWGTRITKLTF